MLKLYLLADLSATDFYVNVYSSTYTTLDTGDWNDQDELQGTLFNTAYVTTSTWYELTVKSTSVNRSGLSQYSIASSRELAGIQPTGYEHIVFAGGPAYYTTPPVLQVDYYYEGTQISIELDSGSYLNGTAFPDVQDWNLTYDLHCYELDTVPSCEERHNSKAGRQLDDLLALALRATTRNPMFSLVLEDVYDSICYRVWFYVPKSNPYTSVHLIALQSFTGEGFFWEQMKVMICDGLTWDNTTAERVAQADFEVEPNQNYTIRVLDYLRQHASGLSVRSERSGHVSEHPSPLLFLAGIQPERDACLDENLLEQQR